MREIDPLQQAKARVAAASRKTHRGTPVKVPEGVLEDARNDLLAQRLAKAIDEAVDPPAPYEPLRKANRRELAKRLRGES